MSGTRRLLSELVMLHELEGDLPEIVVEGHTDAAVIRTYLNEFGIEAEVFAIDDRVEVPGHEVRGLDHDTGCRGRVLAAAEILATDQSYSPTLTFIADADFDHLAKTKGSHPKAKMLIMTDYAAMESYFFTPATLTKFFLSALRSNPRIDASGVINSIQDCLIDLFLCRYIASTLDSPPKIVEKVTSRCIVNGGVVQINLERILEDSQTGKLSRDGIPISAKQLVEEVRGLRKVAAGDPRKYIRGHDIAIILIYFLRKIRPSLFSRDRAAYKQAEVVESTLFACLDYSTLSREKMFMQLNKRLGET